MVKCRRHSINLGLAQAMTAGFASPDGNAARNVPGDLPRLAFLQLEIGSHLKREIERRRRVFFVDGRGQDARLDVDGNRIEIVRGR
jgi:hypothetical protein